MTVQAALDTAFLQEAVGRGLMPLERGRQVVDAARRLAAAGRPVDVLALARHGAPAQAGEALARLYRELKQAMLPRQAVSLRAPERPPETPPERPTRGRTRRFSRRPGTARLDGPPKFDAPPPVVEQTMAMNGPARFADPTPAVAPSPPAFTLPDKIGNYEVLETLGRGAMGAVVKARHVFVQNEVAIKVLHEKAGPNEVERFYREAKAATSLRHPGLVSVFDLGLHEGSPYIVMELVDGEPLSKVIAREGPFPNRRAAAIALQVAEALVHAHKTILHRDIKPENLLVHGDVAKLTDFGLVRRVRKTEKLTAMGDLLGSPAYMSPEQARGEVELDARVDVYGLGATLYEMLTGRAPFTGASLPAVLLAVIEEQPVPPAQLRPDVDRDLERICLKCLAKSPAGRYASAQVLADRLADCIADMG